MRGQNITLILFTKSLKITYVIYIFCFALNLIKYNNSIFFVFTFIFFKPKYKNILVSMCVKLLCMFKMCKFQIWTPPNDRKILKKHVFSAGQHFFQGHVD